MPNDTSSDLRRSPEAGIKILFIVCVVVTCLVTQISTNRTWEWEMLERGAAQYNSQTGDWEWTEKFKQEYPLKAENKQ